MDDNDTKFRRNNCNRMKKILLLLIILPFIVNAQDSTYYKYSYDNSLTGSYAKNSTTTTTLTYVGNNSINRNKLGITSNTTYSLGYEPQISQNELNQRTNISLKNTKYFWFIGHQYNHSFVRKISNDNLLGLGSGFYKDISQFKLSLSYAVIYQKTNYLLLPVKYNLRHSIRFKIVYEQDKISFSTEYYYQPSMINSNIIINGTTSLSIKVHKYMSLTIQDVINYSSTSSVPMIHNLTLGINHKFKNSKNYLVK